MLIRRHLLLRAVAKEDEEWFSVEYDTVLQDISNGVAENIEMIRLKYAAQKDESLDGVNLMPLHTGVVSVINYSTSFKANSFCVASLDEAGAANPVSLMDIELYLQVLPIK